MDEGLFLLYQDSEVVEKLIIYSMLKYILLHVTSILVVIY